MPAKRYLFTPGPTPVPPEVLAALAEPIVHHRGADFRPIYAECIARLKEICRTSSDALLFTASGTGAMESAVANLCSPGTRVVVVSAGAFGERWVEIAERYGCDVVPLRYAWGEVPAAADLEGLLAETDGVRAVFLTHSETSTGVVSDLHAFADATRPSGAHVVVDAVSSLGAVPLEMDAWGIDVVCSGSQKALMTPPGLAIAAVSDAVWNPEGRSSSPRYYFDWERTRKAQDVLDAPFTPGGLARARAQRRARAAARRRARRGIRPSRAPRACVPRRAEGDGARALLPGRRLLRRRDGGQDARRESTRPSSWRCFVSERACSSPAATAR